MESLLRNTYLAAGYFIELLGVWVALPAVGLVPIYVYLLVNLVLHKRPIGPSRPSRFLFGGAVAVLSLWCAVLLTSAMVLGQWGGLSIRP